MKGKLEKILLSLFLLLALIMSPSFMTQSNEVNVSPTNATQVYYTNNFLQLYWGNIIFNPILTTQRVKNEISEQSQVSSTNLTKYNRILYKTVDLRNVEINRSDYPTYDAYWNAYVANSMSYSRVVSISISTSVSSGISATIGEEHIASLGAELGASVTGTETETENIAFTTYPGQMKRLYTYKTEETIYTANHKQTIQTRITFWWVNGESSTTSGTIKTYGSGYDILLSY